MGDIGFGEILALGVIGLIVIGPERLPTYAAQAARFLRELRKQVSSAKSSLIEAADVDPQTLKDLRDLDPRRILQEPLDERPTPPRRSASAPTPIDPDTT